MSSFESEWHYRVGLVKFANASKNIGSIWLLSWAYVAYFRMGSASSVISTHSHTAVASVQWLRSGPCVRSQVYCVSIQTLCKPFCTLFCVEKKNVRNKKKLMHIRIYIYTELYTYLFYPLLTFCRALYSQLKSALRVELNFRRHINLKYVSKNGPNKISHHSFIFICLYHLCTMYVVVVWSFCCAYDDRWLQKMCVYTIYAKVYHSYVMHDRPKVFLCISLQFNGSLLKGL